jgi:hypothetical protein
MSNRAIAARLYVTERTVEAHVTRPQLAPDRRGQSYRFSYGVDIRSGIREGVLAIESL